MNRDIHAPCLTGLYPNSTGIFQNAQIFRQSIPSHHSLPHAFRLAGYHATRIGKLYHYGVPRSIGTNGHDDPASWEIEINPAGVDRMEELAVASTLSKGEFGGTPSWYASPKGDLFHTDGMQATEAEWMLQRPAKAWLVSQRNNPQWKPLFDSTYGLRPREELYDLKTDPHQMHNLAQAPAYATLRADLERRLLDELRNTNDPRLIDDGKFYETPPMSGPPDETRRSLQNRKTKS